MLAVTYVDRVTGKPEAHTRTHTVKDVHCNAPA
jgi:hypothetical protein